MLSLDSHDRRVRPDDDKVPPHPHMHRQSDALKRATLYIDECLATAREAQYLGLAGQASQALHPVELDGHLAVIEKID